MIVNSVIHKKRSFCDISQSCLGANKNIYPNDIGMNAVNIYGCLLPSSELVLSEIVPINGSVTASIHNAMKIAVPAKAGLRPIILL